MKVYFRATTRSQSTTCEFTGFSEKLPKKIDPFEGYTTGHTVNKYHFTTLEWDGTEEGAQQVIEGLKKASEGMMKFWFVCLSKTDFFPFQRDFN